MWRNGQSWRKRAERGKLSTNPREACGAKKSHAVDLGEWVNSTLLTSVAPFIGLVGNILEQLGED